MTARHRVTGAAERWSELHRAAHVPDAQRTARPVGDCWQDRAARFDRVSRDWQRNDPVLPILRSRIRPTDVMLDVGAGVGRHAVPLARHAAKMLAVEPSAAMRSRLAIRIAAEDPAASIRVFPAPWPPPEPLTCDLAYSVHVLYGIADVVPFLDAMTRSARRECILVLGERAPAETVATLWRAVRGYDRHPLPGAYEALAVLQERGYAPSFEVIPASEREVIYSDSDEDIDELCHRVGVPADPSGRARIREALARSRSARAGGGFVLGTTSPLALMAWPGLHR